MGAPLRILVVEDDPLYRRAIDRWVRNRAKSADQVVEIDEATTADDAIGKLVPAPDRIVADIRLPGEPKGGFRLLGVARDLSICPPAFVVSAYLDEESACLAQSFGAWAIPKIEINWPSLAVKIVKGERPPRMIVPEDGPARELVSAFKAEMTRAAIKKHGSILAAAKMLEVARDYVQRASKWDGWAALEQRLALRRAEAPKHDASRPTYSVEDLDDALTEAIDIAEGLGDRHMAATLRQLRDLWRKNQ